MTTIEGIGTGIRIGTGIGTETGIMTGTDIEMKTDTRIGNGIDIITKIETDANTIKKRDIKKFPPDKCHPAANAGYGYQGFHRAISLPRAVAASFPGMFRRVHGSYMDRM